MFCVRDRREQNKLLVGDLKKKFPDVLYQICKFCEQLLVGLAAENMVRYPSLPVVGFLVIDLRGTCSHCLTLQRGHSGHEASCDTGQCSVYLILLVITHKTTFLNEV